MPFMARPGFCFSLTHGPHVSKISEYSDYFDCARGFGGIRPLYSAKCRPKTIGLAEYNLRDTIFPIIFAVIINIQAYDYRENTRATGTA